jgi:hypothetical protein
MYVVPTLAMSNDVDPLQNLRLQRCAETFHGLEAIPLGCFLELLNRRDAQFFVQFEDLVRPKTWNFEHLKGFRRDLFAHCGQRRMAARLMQLCDNVGNRVAHAGDFLQAILGDYVLQRLRQSHEVFGRSRVGPRAIRISASECRPLPEFFEQPRNFRCSKRRHRQSQQMAAC